jgi:hypothetical protein
MGFQQADQLLITSWNKSAYKFEIKESLEASSDEDDKYLEYIGVFRERFGILTTHSKSSMRMLTTV